MNIFVLIMLNKKHAFYRPILGVILLLIAFNGLGQSLSTDLALITEHQDAKNTYYEEKYGNNSNILKLKRKSFLNYVNPINWFFGGTMFLYQNVISPQLASGCQFELSCSNFSKHAIREFGLIKGVFLSADRLMRCNPSAHKEIPIIYYNNKGLIKDSPKLYYHH